MSDALGLIAADRLALSRRRAARVARIERLWPALLPSLFVFGLYLAASLFGWPQALPDWLHALLLGAVGLVMVWLCRRALRRLPVPPAPLAARLLDARIEQASGLRHQPLATLADRPVVSGPGAEALWRAHQGRVAAALSQTRAGWPRLGLARHDPWRLSLLLAIALLAGAVVAGSRAPGRIVSGLWPGYQNREGPPPHVQAWITSPEYSGVAPVFLATDASGGVGQTTIRVPQGAVLTATVTGASRPPSLGGDGRDRRLGPQSWTMTRRLESSTVLRLSAGGYDLPRWHIEVVPRSAPQVGWTEPPTPAMTSGKEDDGSDRSTRDQPLLRLPWHVSHPYGVASLEARITPEGARMPIVVPIPLPGRPRDAKGVATPDLAADPLAGSAASVVLRAADGSGEVGESPVARVRLPAHAFRNPLARAIQAQRRRLALHPERARAIAADLLTLGEAPGALQTQTDLYLELVTAAALVGGTMAPDHRSEAAAMLAEAQGRLWQLALSVEDALGNDRAARAASMELRAAQDSVREQMRRMRELGPQGQNDREQGELRRRVETLNQAIRRRMQALADQARRQGNAIPMDPAMGGGGLDLQKMMQQMQRDAAEGRTDQAMRELKQMQSMLDRMRAATPRDAAAAAQQAQAAAEAREQMAGLKDIIGRQTALLDASQKRDPHPDPTGNPTAAWRDAPGEMPGDAPGGMPGDVLSDTAGDTSAGPPSAPGSSPAAPDVARRDEAQAQHTLQRATDELAQEFKAFQGKLPQKLTDAGEAMQRARAALRQGDDAAASAAQTEALKDLGDGGQQMRQTMSENSSRAESGSGGIIPGFGPDGQGGGGDQGDGGDGSDGGQGSADGQDRDALGRPLNQGSGRHGDDDATSPVLPGADAGARSRALEEELRRRDSDRQRPPAELDYLDRLLRPFAR
ncbi:uncharacterized protein (TIGR02302 family) [Endobacter medicaginis]|uniref:Uncharacterized protein (TIGR02302 family) n=3 Tax=Endobacter medicaginis TaxID=1181271 RepID=A0A839URV2_9PROT|nr:DUF4175 family protein [Endobacter medicaginis]MBB3172506.1 uncharacterized protein (TIGR02302 family) [Endobacter medicaginis]MCX5474006.1 DUF4175 family protein [Endobacter medicaginis]